MKYTPSVMVGSMSGTSGGTVASRWKGILYVRRHVIPHNPKTAAQIVQRGYMARMAGWFRSLPTELVTWLDELGSPCRLSGFNMMAKECLTQLAGAVAPEIAPANAQENAVFSVADGGSTTSDEIDITWVAGEADVAHFAHVFTCPVDPEETAKEEPDAWTSHQPGIVVSALASAAIPVLNTAKDYYVAVIVGDVAAIADVTKFSGGISAVCESGETV